MLNLPEKALDLSDKEWDEEKPKILLVNINSKLIGLMVDSVDKIMVLEDEKLYHRLNLTFNLIQASWRHSKMENDKLLLLLDADELVKIIEKQINCHV